MHSPTHGAALTSFLADGSLVTRAAFFSASHAFATVQPSEATNPDEVRGFIVTVARHLPGKLLALRVGEARAATPVPPGLVRAVDPASFDVAAEALVGLVASVWGGPWKDLEPPPCSVHDANDTPN